MLPRFLIHFPTHIPTDIQPTMVPYPNPSSAVAMVPMPSSTQSEISSFGSSVNFPSLENLSSLSARPPLRKRKTHRLTTLSMPSNPIFSVSIFGP